MSSVAGSGFRVIDVHTHIGCYRDLVSGDPSWSRVTLEVLVSYLDGCDGAGAVVLPVYSWNVDLMPTEYVLEACSRYPGRLIPFCVVDVREVCLKERVTRYVDMGARGFGEHTSKIPVDHERNLKLYRLCGRLEIPILIHVAHSRASTYGVLDTPDLRGLEKVVREYSDVDFIMHGPGWWRCISEHFDPDVEYPEGPVDSPGRAVYLLENYGNVYGDLSAYSGFNALNRDPGFARRFLERLSRKLLYGTDLEGFFEPEKSHLALLKSLNLTDSTLENILHRNIERLLKA